MVVLRKALIFGSAIWLGIEISRYILANTPYLDGPNRALLLLLASVCIIIFASWEYLKEIHAQYELEGLEIAAVFAGVCFGLNLLVYAIFLESGLAFFQNISVWLAILLTFILPLGVGFFMQHKFTE
jgi:hypothetical protein